MKIIKPISLILENIAHCLLYNEDGSALLHLPTVILSKQFLDIPDYFFEKDSDIFLEIIYLNGSKTIFSKRKNCGWSCCEGDVDYTRNPFRQNLHTIYQNTTSDKNEIQRLLRIKYNESLMCDGVHKGNKNLIYYTAGGDKEYLKLLEKSVSSLWENSEKKFFEFLFICPESWQQDIESFKPIGCVFKYHIVEDCADGVEISKNKTKIFDFSEINQYKKILYLDSDIIAVRNVDHIFVKNYSDKLFVACNVRKVSFSSHSGDYHGLKYFSDSEIQELKNANQRPFNAGQFLFINSDAMKKHFENLNWLMSVWPGEYFFEQSFMNHYFCGFLLTENESLGKKVKILSTIDNDNFNPKFDHDDILVHFIAPALNPTAKINYIEEYINAHLS